MLMAQCVILPVCDGHLGCTVYCVLAASAAHWIAQCTCLPSRTLLRFSWYQYQCPLFHHDRVGLFLPKNGGDGSIPCRRAHTLTGTQKLSALWLGNTFIWVYLPSFYIDYLGQDMTRPKCHHGAEILSSRDSEWQKCSSNKCGKLECTGMLLTSSGPSAWSSPSGIHILPPVSSPCIFWSPRFALLYMGFVFR